MLQAAFGSLLPGVHMDRVEDLSPSHQGNYQKLHLTRQISTMVQI